MRIRLFRRLPFLPLALAAGFAFAGAASLCVMGSKALPSAPAPPPVGLPSPAPDASRPSRGEAEVASLLGDFYDSCFRSFVIDTESMELRIPFGQNGERKGGSGWIQAIEGGGKASPESLWAGIEESLASGDFASYLAALETEGDKLFAFDLESGLWAVDLAPESVAAFRAGPYPGSPSLVYALKEGAEPTAQDVYNYLYCVARLGLDCAGFVFNAEESLCRALGASLGGELAAALSLDPAEAALHSGLWLFDPANGWSRGVEPAPASIRPGDILLFRGHLGEYKHSAIVRSVDRAAGVIRYAQCTDWAPGPERGVHESFILFDPAMPDLALGDSTVAWTQALGPSFPGEDGGPSWPDDGGRFRARWREGPSLVVRLGPVMAAIEAFYPNYYYHHTVRAPAEGKRARE
jgi:hypothetical protein